MGSVARAATGRWGNDMAMTPDEVQTKEFVRVLRGYDPAEVASFLRVVASEMRKRD